MGLFEHREKQDEGPARVIDLRAHRRGQAWGQPGPCPECGGPGYLDQVDLRARAMHQHCTECGNRWSVTEAELAPS